MSKAKLSSHLKGAEKQELISRYKANKDLFDRVIHLLELRKESARKTQISNSSYEQPAWSERQADLNGYQRALDEIKTLITI